MIPAELVILNGRVWTVDEERPRAEAVAFAGGRVAFVGSDAEARRWVGPSTRLVDAKGHTVLPGLIDAHVHLTPGSFMLSQVQLRNAATREEFAGRIGEYAGRIPKGEWILGGTWDHELWGGALPTCEWIDAVTPEHPVFVKRYDIHMGLANSAALKLAGVTRETAAPEGGEIVKDAKGEPTGLLKDAAMDFVHRVIPAASVEQRLRALRAGMREAARLGVTSVHDISSVEDLRSYQELARRGELTLRIYAITPLPQWEAPAGAGIQLGFGGEWVRTGAVKGFSDGSLGSATALFFAPYNDAPETCGLPAEMMFPAGNMQRMMRGADAAGLQLVIHAIGDKANRIILDSYEAMRKENGPSEHRWRIEHAQHLHPDDIPRFAKLDVIASMQPFHAVDDGRWAERRIGRERCRTTYAIRSLLDSGAKVAFGSDWPVATIDPLLGMHAAVTRQTSDGKNPQGWIPEQKITIEEAIHGYTMGAAYAGHAEGMVGSLTVGKLGDAVVLDADLFAVGPEKIGEVRVDTTIVGGRVVYEAGGKAEAGTAG